MDLEERDGRAGTFQELRPLLFSIAYRMVGVVADAEDLVQEAFLRFEGAGKVHDPKAFLTTVVTRLALDHLKSARVRRERYVGPWLPEPIVGTAPDPAEAVELADTLSMAFLTVLETLAPTERAAFLLREVFGHPYDEIARTLGLSEANCRQLVHRARGHVEARRARFGTSRERQRELLASFLFACGTGDPADLAALLTEDAVLYSDGGGRVRAALMPIHGPAKIARFLLGILRKAPPGFASEVREVNGAPGLVSWVDGVPYAVVTLAVAEGRIEAVYIVSNPEKLERIAAGG